MEALQNITVNAIPAWGLGRFFDDWMLNSFSPWQLEVSLMKAYFGSNANPSGTTELQYLDSTQMNFDSEYAQTFSHRFWDSLQMQTTRNSHFLVILVSPITHAPHYGEFHNSALSRQVLWGIDCFTPNFRENLRLMIIRFLSSPDAVICPPPPRDAPGSSRMIREGKVPVRIFAVRFDDSHSIPGSNYNLSGVALQHLYYTYNRLPKLRYPYTASMYVASKRARNVIDFQCIGYLKRLLPEPKLRK